MLLEKDITLELALEQSKVYLNCDFSYFCYTCLSGKDRDSFYERVQDILPETERVQFLASVEFEDLL